MRGFVQIASHYLEITLKPGENKDLIFVLGYVENEQDEKWESKGIINKKKADDIINSYDSVKKVDEAFEELKKRDIPIQNPLSAILACASSLCSDFCFLVLMWYLKGNKHNFVNTIF